MPESLMPDTVPTTRARAIESVNAAVSALARLGVSVVVTGSLARGGFGPGSDVDLLVTACPKELKYAIEGIVEDHLDGLAFDVIYHDELPAWKRASFAEGAVDAGDLR